MNPTNYNNNLRPKLSCRQIEIVELIVNENTTGEIANKLNLSKETITTHRNNIMIKLGVKSIAGIVREALVTKIIEIK